MEIDPANKSFKIKQFAGGAWDENCYVLYNTQTRNAILIDPGWGSRKIKKFLESNSLNLKFILNTHGHIDHIGRNHSFDVPVYIHKDDARFLTDPLYNLSGFTLTPYRSPKATTLLKDGDEIEFESEKLTVMHTPGHTPGCIVVRFSDCLFTGDTLFAGSIGRTDFPYGDSEKIITSIHKKILSLDDSVRILPGHGPISTVGHERKTNPFVGDEATL